MTRLPSLTSALLGTALMLSSTTLTPAFAQEATTTEPAPDATPDAAPTSPAASDAPGDTGWAPPPGENPEATTGGDNVDASSSATATEAPAADATADPIPAPVPEMTSPPPATPDAATMAPAEAQPFVAPEGFTKLDDLGRLTASQVLGANIHAESDGAKIGDISDIVLDPSGTPGALIVDVGGFLGLGVHRVKLTLDQLVLYRNADGKIIASAALDKTRAEQLPAWDEAEAK